jgi:hypothetical protein
LLPLVFSLHLRSSPAGQLKEFFIELELEVIVQKGSDSIVLKFSLFLVLLSGNSNWAASR